MKAKPIFISIHMQKDKKIVALDYPQNIPLPRIGEFVIFSDNEDTYSGTVKAVHHTITNGLANIQILTKEIY